MTTTTSTSGHSSADTMSHDYETRAKDQLQSFAYSGGKLFGFISVPKDMELLARGAQTAITSALTQWAEKAGGSSPVAQKVIRWGLPLAIESVPLVQCGLKWRKDMSAFNDRLKPFLAANAADKSGMDQLFGSEEPNAIVEFARKQRSAVHLNALASVGVNAGVNIIGVGTTLSPKAKGWIQTINDSEFGKNLGSFVGGSGNLVNFGIGLGADRAQKYIQSKVPAKMKGKCALDLTEEFVKSMTGVAKNIDPFDDHDVDRACKNAQRAILEIFDKRYAESGWPDMPERVREELEVLALRMAKPMVTGELSPWAILNFAGENAIVQNEGSVVANEDEFKAAMATQMVKFAADKTETVKEYYGKVSFRNADLVKAIASKELGEEEKAFVAAVVPEKILISAGLKKEEYDHFHAEGEKIFEKRAAYIVTQLAQQPVKELHEHYSKAEIDLIQRLGTHLERLDAKSEGNDKASVEALEERTELLSKSAVRRILANAYVKDARGWEKRIKDEREPTIDAAAEEKDTGMTR